MDPASLISVAKEMRNAGIARLILTLGADSDKDLVGLDQCQFRKFCDVIELTLTREQDPLS
jgi:hypothetical protein